MPCGANRVRVLVVGGGGGGGSGAAGGGAAGFVCSEVFEVEQLVVVKISVGKGGKGSTRKDTCRQDSRYGARSSFGGFLHADGGGSHNGPCFENWQGASGGSGGGEGCINSGGYCSSGSGGSGGSNGNYSSRGQAFGIGKGQSSYSAQLKQFRMSSITVGAGGKGRLYAAAGGGGGGGVFIDGSGPSAEDGERPIGEMGGKGFGAGGGSGFLDSNEMKTSPHIYHRGDVGADGVVYIEWWWESKSSKFYKIRKTNVQYSCMS